jgi:signal transduction histidine kinase
MQASKEAVVIAILTGSLFMVLFGFISFLVILNFMRSKRKIFAERKEREAQFQQELLQAQLEMQEHTFKTISQEIHDNVGQILSIIKVNLNILTYENAGNEKLEDVKTMLTDAIKELRDLGAGYYADRLVEEGFLVAIQHQLLQLSKTGLFKTSFHTELETLSIDKNKVIFLHRMVQEILHNVVKHSGADHVVASISKENDEIHVSLSDNGKGFDTHSESFKAGIGLSSIRQRASMIGANVTITSKIGSGTIVKLAFRPHD